MATERKPITIVTGGQYGSEAKGAVAAWLVNKRKFEYAVRTGATNAGHTVEYNEQFYAMQQLPVGWVNPDTRLVLGAGAIIDPVILQREIELIHAATGKDPRPRIYVDPRAYIHRADHARRSAQSGRHHAIGATGKGCSEAVIDRIQCRGVVDYTVAGWLRQEASSGPFNNVHLTDTERLLNMAVNTGAQVMLEGCQGTMLDLMLGPYPYTTHKQTTPANWMSEVGLSPALPVEIVMVLRTYPIRVAGNSGPLPHETSWPRLARSINMQRANANLPPIVAESALVEFEEALRQVAADKFKGKLPSTSDGTDQEYWTPAERTLYKAALSELNKSALERLTADTTGELKKLFEMTTVTKKLRRVAQIGREETDIAVRQVRPTSLAITFMNYMFPEVWGASAEVEPTEREQQFVDMIEATCNAPVLMFNRGPRNAQIVETAR